MIASALFFATSVFAQTPEIDVDEVVGYMSAEFELEFDLNTEGGAYSWDLRQDDPFSTPIYFMPITTILTDDTSVTVEFGELLPGHFYYFHCYLTNSELNIAAYSYNFLSPIQAAPEVSFDLPIEVSTNSIEVGIEVEWNFVTTDLYVELIHKATQLPVFSEEILNKSYDFYYEVDCEWVTPGTEYIIKAVVINSFGSDTIQLGITTPAYVGIEELGVYQVPYWSGKALVVGTQKPVELNVYNLLGEQLHSEKVFGPTQIPLSLSPGIYLWKIDDHVGKFSIQKN